MQTVLWGVIIGLLIIIFVFAFRLFGYHAQVNHLLKELKNLEKETTNYQITSCCPIGKTVKMITAMNHIIENYRKTEIILKKENRIYKESIQGISHDIRTPLTSAKGYIQMLQNEDIQEDKKKEYINIVKKRLDNLSDLLNQLFEYTRIEAGEMNMEPEIFLAGNVFAETISMFYEDFIKTGCEPTVDIISLPCYIQADRNAFIRIIENLLKNALIHGTGEYKISLTKRQKQVVLCVSNQTDSIEQKDIAYIFDRFYTTDQSRTRKTTGLGLAIVKRFSEQMGGTAEAYLTGDRFSVEVCIPLYEKQKNEITHDDCEQNIQNR